MPMLVLLLAVTTICYVPKLMTICGAVCVLHGCFWPCSGIDVVWLLLSSFAFFRAASVLYFGQWVLIDGCGWWGARGRLRVVHGDIDIYRRRLSLIVGLVERDLFFACVVTSRFICHCSPMVRICDSHS